LTKNCDVALSGSAVRAMAMLPALFSSPLRDSQAMASMVGFWWKAAS
jgi:hypothetical protein